MNRVAPPNIHIIDSHTGGEPTRTIVSGGPDLGHGSMAERLAIMAADFDHIRRSLILEPRGSDVMVGALLCQPQQANHTAGVIFFNNTGYLGMCGHGTIGLLVTLYHLGKIDLGLHYIETPVGLISAQLHSANEVTINNVASYRYRQGVTVNVAAIGPVTGDIAWGGNWFFLVKNHGLALTLANHQQLMRYTSAIQTALLQQGIFGADQQVIDHIELFGPPTDTAIADSQNFVLCPGQQYDRSPCGTGTSAKLACLYQDGQLAAGQIWRQQSITGSIFAGQVAIEDQQIIPTISGQAFVTMDSQVIFNHHDPLTFGF